jgi:hypothetical protein
MSLNKRRSTVIKRTGEDPRTETEKVMDERMRQDAEWLRLLQTDGEFFGLSWVGSKVWVTAEEAHKWLVEKVRGPITPAKWIANFARLMLFTNKRLHRLETKIDDLEAFMTEAKEVLKAMHGAVGVVVGDEALQRKMAGLQREVAGLKADLEELKSS